MNAITKPYPQSIEQLNNLMDGLNFTKVEIGKGIEIEKLYGPLVMANIRVFIDLSRAEWVIEREIVPKEGEGSWEVCARIDGQNSITFNE